MTIGIALKYDDGIVLGSDSQVTAGDLPYKTQSTKVEQIGSRVGLIAAGSLDFYKELVRKLHDYKDEIDKSTMPSVTDLVSQTMATMYSLYTQRFGKQKIEEVIHLAPVDMLVAGIDESGPQIFHIRPPGIIGPEDPYSVIGSGIFYASVVLKKRYRKDMNMLAAGRLVTRAIKETAEMDPYVDDKVQLFAIDLHVDSNGIFQKEITGGGFHRRFGEFYLKRFEDEIKDEDTVFKALFGELPEDLSPELRKSSENLGIASMEFIRQLELEREKNF